MFSHSFSRGWEHSSTQTGIEDVGAELSEALARHIEDSIPPVGAAP